MVIGVTNRISISTCLFLIKTKSANMADKIQFISLRRESKNELSGEETRKGNATVIEVIEKVNLFYQYIGKSMPERIRTFFGDIKKNIAVFNKVFQFQSQQTDHYVQHLIKEVTKLINFC